LLNVDGGFGIGKKPGFLVGRNLALILSAVLRTLVILDVDARHVLK